MSAPPTRPRKRRRDQAVRDQEAAVRAVLYPRRRSGWSVLPMQREPQRG